MALEGWLSRDEKSKFSFGKDASAYNWKRYFFRQIGNSLAYYKSDAAPKQSGTFAIDDVSEIQLIPDGPDIKNGFKLVTRGKGGEMLFMAETPEARDFWTNAISDLNCLNGDSSPPLHSSGSSSSLASSSVDDLALPGRGRARDPRARPMSVFGDASAIPQDLQAALASRGRGLPMRSRGGMPPIGRGADSPAPDGDPVQPSPFGPRRGGAPRGAPPMRPVSSMVDVRERTADLSASAPPSPPPKPRGGGPGASASPLAGRSVSLSAGEAPVLADATPDIPQRPVLPRNEPGTIPRGVRPTTRTDTPRTADGAPPSKPAKPSPPPSASPPDQPPAVEPPSLPQKPPVVPPSLPSKPAIEPPSLPSKPAIEPPSLPSKPAIEPPSLPSKPAIEPPSLPSKPAIEPPSLPSKPAIEPPSLPSKPAIEPPSLPSKPAIEPPSLPSKPAIEPPSLPSKPAIEPPSLPSKPAIEPPSLPSRPAIEPPSLPSKPAVSPPTLPQKPTGVIEPPALPPPRRPGSLASPPGLPSKPPLSPRVGPRAGSSVPDADGGEAYLGGSSDSLSVSEEQTVEEERPLSPEEQKALIQQKRTKIVDEILSTEETYIKNLSGMLTIYKRIFEEWVDQLEGKVPSGAAASARASRARPVSTVVSKAPQSKFKREHLKVLFSNLQFVLPLNEQLYEEISKRHASWDEQQKIGDVFEKMAPYFKLYNEYSNNYELALQLYDKMREKDPAFKAVLEMAEAEAELQGVLRFANLLILPIQRVPRYSLLIGDLLRKTNPDHPDYVPLQEACKMLELTANFLDKNIKDAENNRRLLKLAAEGASGLLASHRVLIREGTITASSNQKQKKFKLRLTLFNDLLVHLSSKKRSNMEQQKHQWPLYLVWLKDLVDAELDEKYLNVKEKEKYPFAFQVTGPLDTYIFWFPDNREKQSWYQSIASATIDEIGTKKFLQTVPTEIAEKVSAADIAAMAPDKPVRVGLYNMLNGGVYRGWWDTGKMHGFGAFSFFDNIYLGEFAWNVKNGMGELHYATGEVYTGRWAHDYPHGQGTFTHPNGEQYVGNWESGGRKGPGVFTSQMGDRYEGDWDDDLPNGSGTLTLSDGTKYSGSWAQGQFDKQGVLEMADGRVYRGEWSRGLRQGEGFFDYTNGTTYEGGWFQGKQNGKGFLKTPTYAYEGDFVDDEPHGKGVMEWINGSRYEGDWYRGKFHGVGEYSSPVGRIKLYKGEWVHHQMHGTGQITYRNECTFSGQFTNNIPNGKGIFLFPDKTRLECSWKGGQPEGKANLLAGQNSSKKLQTLQGKVQAVAKSFEPATGEPVILLPPTTTFPILQIFL